ncbi:MAG: trypsin-like peptidase domain-containing protein [Thermoflavifilum sp.]|nr:trypsin-like peptidase domain-containing protein [Thermoflavifilum sp.]MCL6514063.1 trypsin-like peptidase domain-containing protein [Alicyclobacillus sp.]
MGTAGNTVASQPSTTQTNSNTSGPITVQNLTSSAGATNITAIYQAVEPAVVAIVNYQSSGGFFNQSQGLQESGVGSGVLIKKDSQYGYFVTNNHVVYNADKLEIVLSNGTHVQATVVGADPYTDLAVIRVPVSQVKNIQPVAFANSDQVVPGQEVIAIGAPGGLDFRETVTSGIVSGIQRLMPVLAPDDENTVLDYQSVIQTDAPINPGNSGGPLLSTSGQIVGINSSKIVETGFENMGFAIPANEVSDVVNQILTTGHVEHPALGIEAYSLSSVPQAYWPDVPVTYGVYVYAVTSSQAKQAGLQQGDVIVAVGNKTVQDEADLRTALFSYKPGQTVSITVYRGSQKLTLNVTLGSLSASPQG